MEENKEELPYAEFITEDDKNYVENNTDLKALAEDLAKIQRIIEKHNCIKNAMVICYTADSNFSGFITANYKLNHPEVVGMFIGDYLSDFMRKVADAKIKENEEVNNEEGQQEEN